MNFLSPNLSQHFRAGFNPSTFAQRSESNRYRAFAQSAPNGPLSYLHPLSILSPHFRAAKVQQPLSFNQIFCKIFFKKRCLSGFLKRNKSFEPPVPYLCLFKSGRKGTSIFYAGKYLGAFFLFFLLYFKRCLFLQDCLVAFSLITY